LSLLWYVSQDKVKISGNQKKTVGYDEYKTHMTNSGQVYKFYHYCSKCAKRYSKTFIRCPDCHATLRTKTRPYGRGKEHLKALKEATIKRY
jgi:hypothetical protein